MHLATYTKNDAGKMLAHYERCIGKRDHIDESLPVYNLAPNYEGGSVRRFNDLCRGLEIGAKTKPLADFVFTKPQGFDGDVAALFRHAYDFLREKVGDDRIVSAYVHMDEPGAEPHMHFAFVPVVESAVMTNDKSQPLRWTKKDEQKNPEHVAGTVKKDSKGTVRYKRVPLVGEGGKPVVRRTATASKLFSRADMAKLHPGMESYLCAALGVERVGVLLDEDDKNKKWSALDHDDYVTVTTQRDKAIAAREEAAKQEAEAILSFAKFKVATEAARAESVLEVGKLQGLQTEVAEKQVSSAALDSEIEKKTAEKSSLAAEIADFSAKRNTAKASCEAMEAEEGQIKERLERLRQREEEEESEYNKLGSRQKDLAREVGELESFIECGGDGYEPEEHDAVTRERDRLKGSCRVLGERLEQLVEKVKELVSELWDVPEWIARVLEEFGLKAHTEPKPINYVANYEKRHRNETLEDKMAEYGRIRRNQVTDHERYVPGQQAEHRRKPQGWDGPGGR